MEAVVQMAVAIAHEKAAAMVVEAAEAMAVAAMATVAAVAVRTEVGAATRAARKRQRSSRAHATSMHLCAARRGRGRTLRLLCRR